MFKTQLTIAAHPDLTLQVKMAPLSFELGGAGSFGLVIGEIDARCDAIPLSMTIPFLRRRRGRVIAGSIGPFGVRLKPIEAQASGVDIGLRGILGKDGLECDLRGIGACKAEIEASGKMPAKIVKAAVEGVLEE